MPGPSWLAGTFAGIMILTSGYCASRLLAARQRRRPIEVDVDVMHTVMGVAMAGMLVPRLKLLGYGSWEVVFTAAMGWFGWQIIGAYRGRPASAHPSAGGHRPAAAHHLPDGHRQAHHAPHLLGCAAMVYMCLVAGAARTATGVPGMAAGGTSASTIRSPALALPLAVALLGYVIWTTDRLTALPAVAALASAPLTAAARASARPGGTRRAGAGQTSTGRAGGADRGPEPGRPPMSPRLAACCEIAMGVTMGYMLIQLI